MFANPTAPQSETERLALLYRVTQTFNSSLDLDQVLNLVMDEVITATRAERGFLMLRDNVGQMCFQTARGLDQQIIDQPESQVSHSVIDRVAQLGKAVITSNAQSDDWLSERKSVMVLGLRSVLCVPIIWKGIVQGVIYVDNRIQAGIFTTADLDLLGAIAAAAASAIENARLYQLAVTKGRMERELQLARQVQVSLLPHQLPVQEGWEFAARWIPAREVAGDFYDVVLYTPDEAGLVIADVADKGMPAALYMGLSRSLVRASVIHAHTPAEGITNANRLICSDTAGDMFITLVYARLGLYSGELTYVNAGHNPPLHFSAAHQTWTRLTRTGMAMGVDEDFQYEQHIAHLEHGDLVVFYTDGVTEAANAAGEGFGEERFQALLQQHVAEPANQLVETIARAVQDYSGIGEDADDDITLMVVRRLVG